jgi:hypothetical protein
VIGTLDGTGKATLTYTFTAAYDYQVNACYFAADGSGFTDSESGYQPYPVTLSPPVITRQPASLTVVAGGQATFTATASGTPTPTVQWQRSIDGGQSWADVAGATNETLQLTATAGMNGDQFHAVFTNAGGSTTSDAATLSVGESFLGFQTPGQRARVNRGSSLPVAFKLGDASGTQLDDATAASIPARVQLWSSPSGPTVATAGCKYDPTTDVYKCVLKVPSGIPTGMYYLAAQTRLGAGPWVLDPAYGRAVNPQMVRIV